MEVPKSDVDLADNKIDQKLPFKRLEFPLKQVVSVAIPLHIQQLNEHCLNIESSKTKNYLSELRREQTKASKTVQLLKTDLFELEQVHLKVKEEDQELFHKIVQASLKDAVEALSNFMLLHSDILGPFLDLDGSILSNPSEFPAIICDLNQESTQQASACSSGGLIQLQTEGIKKPSENWSFLRKELVEIHSLITSFASLVFRQQESVDSIQSNLIDTHENVRTGTEYLRKASLLKAASFPIVGALIGGVILGPFGALAGFKLLGSVACVAGGSAIGYSAGTKLKKKQQALCSIEMKALTYQNKSISSSSPDLSAERETYRED